MVHRRLGRSNLLVSPIGFGAFKIGRNEGIKYPQGYELPDEKESLLPSASIQVRNIATTTAATAAMTSQDFLLMGRVGQNRPFDIVVVGE